MIRKWFIIGILGLLVLYLMWGFLTQALLYNPIAEIQRSANTQTPQKTTTTAEFTHAWSTRILRNNLFSSSRHGATPSRRPRKVTAEVKAPPPPPPPPPPPRPDVVLSGIIRNSDGEFVAILSINKQDAVSLRVGESIEGLSVVDIQERSVTLLWNQTDEFRLSMQTAKTNTR